jgi:hypothetical protein
MKHDRSERHERRPIGRAIQAEGTWLDEAQANANLMLDAPKLLRQRDRLLAALKALERVDFGSTWDGKADLAAMECRAAIAEVEADDA